MQPVTSALDLDLAQVVRFAAFQAGEGGLWKAHYAAVVQGDHHAFAAPVVPCVHGEKLVPNPVGCPSRDRVEFPLGGRFEFSHGCLVFKFVNLTFIFATGCRARPVLADVGDPPNRLPLFIAEEHALQSFEIVVPA